MRVLQIVVVLAVLVFSGCEEKLSESVLEVENDFIDLGEVHTGKQVFGSIILSNHGDMGVKLLSTHSDCQCTVLEPGFVSVAPNESKKLEFSFTPNFPGFHQQKILIETNSIRRPRLLVVIRAKAV